MSLQGAIFLFFAGRIEAIKGNIDAVSDVEVSWDVPAQREVRHIGAFSGVGGLHGRAGLGGALLTGVVWGEGGDGVCAVGDTGLWHS